jgi:hypothetical protein
MKLTLAQEEVMRKAGLLIGVTFLAACGPTPRQFSGPAPAPAAMTCVEDRLEGEGYQVISGSGESGALRAQRLNDEPWVLNILGFNDSADIVDAATTGSEVRISAYSQVTRAGERRMTSASADAREAARSAFSACVDDGL